MDGNKKEFENFVRGIKFDDTPDLSHRDKLEEELLLAMAKQHRQKSQPLRIWRIIMKSRMRKLVAAVVVIAALIGVYQFGGGRAAFGQMTEAVRTSLARLKEMIVELRTKEPLLPSPSRRRIAVDKKARQNVDIPYKQILAKVKLFSLQREEYLEEFLERQGIEFVPTTGDPSISYAVLDPEKTKRFNDFSQSAVGLKLFASPMLILRDDHEGALASEDFALAVAGTVLEDTGRIDLSFSFHDGQAGFKIPSITTEVDQAVLIRGAKGTEGSGEGTSDILVLIQVEVH